MEHYFEHIQDYLDGLLTPEERRVFEQELQRNVALREETNHQRELHAIIGKHQRAAEGLPALQETLRQVSDNHFASRPALKKRRMITWLIPMAAAACLLVAFNFFGWFTTDFNQLPEMSLAVTRGNASDTDYEEAARAFNAADYDSSAELLAALVQRDTTVIRYRFFLGLSHIGQQDYHRAAAQLRPIADGPSVFADDARYFTAVALWHIGNEQQAANYAKQVTVSSPYYEKAEKLLRKLQ